MQPWQHRDFAALDAAWMSLAGIAQNTPDEKGDILHFRTKRRTQMEPSGENAECPLFRRAYIERPRGHSKTSDTAMQIAWILLAAKRSLSGIAAAADRDQANLIHRAIRRLAAVNDDVCGELQFIQHVVKNPHNGARMEIISSDVASSWGALPDFVVCDELCHWKGPELWYSLASSAAKQPGCVLVVLTNAGIGRGWQWTVREHARRDPAWYFSSLDGPQAPWVSETSLAEQRAILPPPVFERLWLNIWQHSDGEFVTLAEAEACRDESLAQQERGVRGRWYVAAVDYAEKHDFTVGCVCHDDGARIVVDRMDVVRPTPRRPTPVSWVDDWIEDVAARFPDVTFVIDEHQLVGTIQKLQERFPVTRFDFAAGRGNHRLAIRLRQLIIHRQVAWYAGCGDISLASGVGPAVPAERCRIDAVEAVAAGTSGPTATALDAYAVPRDDLETELASLLLKHSETGRLRIDHHRDGVHHDDRAFALGAACLTLSEHARGPDIFLITPPTPAGGFRW
jgi:hypothetical protein